MLRKVNKFDEQEYCNDYADLVVELLGLYNSSLKNNFTIRMASFHIKEYKKMPVKRAENLATLDETKESQKEIMKKIKEVKKKLKKTKKN